MPIVARAIVAVHPGMTDERLRPVIATLYALLFMSLVEGMLHYPRFIMLVMICIAMVLAGREEGGTSPDGGPRT